jgi:5'-AMP-activated protein kinase, regulatory beta subunit
VEVEGSYDGWTSRTPLHRAGGRDTWTVIKLLPPGVHQYKFIVDGVWKYAPEQPAMYDERGNVNNVCEVSEVAPENLDNLSNFAPPGSPPSSYDCGLSDAVGAMAAGGAGPSSAAGAPAHPPAEQLKEPPQAPPQLHLTLLNVPPLPDAPSILPRPQHVVLNHVYTERPRDDASGRSAAGAGPSARVSLFGGSGSGGASSTAGGSSSSRAGSVVMGITHRYRSKYVTLVMYKPLRRPTWAASASGGQQQQMPGHPHVQMHQSPALSSGPDAMSQG